MDRLPWLFFHVLMVVLRPVSLGYVAQRPLHVLMGIQDCLVRRGAWPFVPPPFLFFFSLPFIAFYKSLGSLDVIRNGITIFSLSRFFSPGGLFFQYRYSARLSFFFILKPICIPEYRPRARTGL